jgi:hypothetical protein
MGGGCGLGPGAGGENSNGGAIHGAGREGSGYGGEGGQNAPSKAPTAPSGQGRSVPRGGFNQGGLQRQSGSRGVGDGQGQGNSLIPEVFEALLTSYPRD